MTAWAGEYIELFNRPQHVAAAVGMIGKDMFVCTYQHTTSMCRRVVPTFVCPHMLKHAHCMLDLITSPCNTCMSTAACLVNPDGSCVAGSAS